MASNSIAAPRKKRTVPDNSGSSVPDDDHRKRRRNRTTQSCLNCHTSKRMCDRKRPCGRCTQLGLTGLCVYEVDCDPSQRVRGESQDESARLRKRVAELEGVIRELKNKPNPRWVQSGNSPGDEFEKWHARTQNRGCDDGSSNDTRSHPSSPPNSTDTANTSEQSSCLSLPSLKSPILHIQPPSPPPSNASPPLLNINTSSPLSTPSPAVLTPSDEMSHSPFHIAEDNSDLTRDLDLASMFLSNPAVMYHNEGASYSDHDRCDRYKEPASHNFRFATRNHADHGSPDGHCGCLHDSASYNVLLELSLRLRKATDVMGRSNNHRMGLSCLLNQRIAELDALATTTMGNIAHPPESTSHLATPPHTRARQNSNANLSLPPITYGSGQARPSLLAPPAAHSPSSHAPRSWDLLPSLLDSAPSSYDDSFMSWEPPRRS